MADRFTDEESGIIFHYLPDLSNGVEIVVPPDADGEGTAVSIPMGALVRFFFEAVLSREKAILLTKAFATMAGALGETVERFAEHAFTSEEKLTPKGRLQEAAQALLDWHDGPELEKINGVLATHQARGYPFEIEGCGKQIEALREALKEDEE